MITCVGTYLNFEFVVSILNFGTYFDQMEILFLKKEYKINFFNICRSNKYTSLK